MLDVPMIKTLFHSLSEELGKQGVNGEVGICRGALMCLVFQSRKSTKDIDAVFHPTEEIRKASKAVAKQFGISTDWLNDAAKAYFHVDPPREEVLEYPYLRVWAPRADYMLAMKCISARFDTHDLEDVMFLLKYLQLNKKEKVFQLIEKYYPQKSVPPKTRFLVEELLEA